MKRGVTLIGILMGLLLIAGAKQVFAQANFYAENPTMNRIVLPA